MRHSHRRLRRTCAVLLLAALLLPWAQPVLAAKTWSEERERREGEETVKAILEQVAEWEDEEQKARCQAIVDAIVPYTERPDVKYTARLLDTDSANAVSLPGGTIFVTRGLLEPVADADSSYLAVQSEDELAGILAHEIAHNCHYHGLRNADRGQDLFKGGIAAALLALLLGGGAAGAFQVLGMGMKVGQGVLSHYSVQYETQADRSAVDYLVKTDYNPNGLLTFIERLAAEERSRAPVDLGIYQTHPYSAERVQGIRRLIRSHGVEVNRRAVTSWRRAEALDAVVDGQPAAVVMLWDRDIYSFRVAAPTGETPAQRAKAAAQRLNEALAKGMAEYDLRVESDDAGPYVTVMGGRLLTVLTGDAEQPATPQELADRAAHQLRAAMFGDALGRRFRLDK